MVLRKIVQYNRLGLLKSEVPAFTPGAFTGLLPIGLSVSAFSVAAFSSPGDPKGIIIGVVVSYTVTLQQVLFTQLPVPYAFPWVITVAVILLSFIFGLLAAVLPLRSILSKSPVAILRV